MSHRILLPILLVSGLAAQADVLSPTQRFFGLGGQYPEYTDSASETPASVSDQAPYSPADSDLGVQEVMVRRGPREPVFVDFTTAILATDSAPSGTGFQRSSWVSASNLTVSWRPHIARGWFADLGVGQDLVRYDRTNATDFENFNTRIGVFKLIPELDDTIFYARFEYQRITSGTLFDGDYHAQRVRAGLQKALWSQSRQQLVANVSGAYEWSANPDSFQRNEFSSELVYTYSFTDTLYASMSAKASWFDFDNFGRDDMAYGLAAGVFWQACPNFKAGASLFFDKNVSDRFGNFNEYEAWSGGPSVSAMLSF